MNRFSNELDCDYVKNDNVYGSYIAVQHLLEKGYRRINYLCARPHTTTGLERVTGGCNAVKDAGFPENVFTITHIEESIQACYDLVQAHAKASDLPDAYMVWNDTLALGVQKALLELEIRIPQDVALVGYDDLVFAEYMVPPLTTVKQQNYELGEQAAEILIRKIEKKMPPEEKMQIELKPQLIPRKST